MRSLLNPQTKAERSASIDESLSCECVYLDFCLRQNGELSSDWSIFGRSDQLSWALQVCFCHCISSKLRICSEKAKNCVFIAATY